MVTTPNEAMAAAESMQTSMFRLGKDRTEALLSMQKELLATYEQASRVWLARIRSEADLWSEFATKLGTTRSFPDAIQSYQELMSQRMKIAAEDAQRLSDEYGNIVQKLSRSMTNGWFSGST
jgi:hypothetical protein